MSSATKIVLILLFISAFALALSAIGALISTFVLTPLGEATGLSLLGQIPVGLILWLLVICLPGRWTALPIKHRIHATAHINAPIQAVWDQMEPRNRSEYWSASVVATRVDPDDPDLIGFEFEGLEGTNMPKVLWGRVLAREAPTYFAYVPLNGHEFPYFGQDLILSEYKLKEAGMGTEVQLVENLERLRLVAIPLLLFLNPCRDGLISLKAVCEGTEDTSWMAQKAEEFRTQ